MKSTFWTMITAVVFVGMASIFCGGCGKTDAQQAGDAARTFMSGSANGDRAMVESTLTKMAREKVENGSVSLGGENGVGHDGYTVGTPTIDDNSASVPVTVTKTSDSNGDENRADSATVTEVAENKGSRSDAAKTDAPTETITLKLRRENGQWKIWAMRVPMVPGGPTLTMDFEHPEAVLGDAFKGIGEGVGAAMKGMGEGLGAMFKGMADGAKAADQAAHSPASSR